MPIKPENKARYPKDWPKIRDYIMLRAGSKCEEPGCAARHGAIGYWYDGKFKACNQALRDAGAAVPGTMVACADGSYIKIIKIVLTIAHLDHTPENCDPSNLRAWCQRHHLRYDQDHHKQTAYMTRKAKAQTMELPL